MQSVLTYNPENLFKLHTVPQLWLSGIVLPTDCITCECDLYLCPPYSPLCFLMLHDIQVLSPVPQSPDT